MLRRSTLAALAAFAVFFTSPARPAHAQYMFLDSDGDGVHTDADVLSSTGPTSVDVWLVTNQNRDGSPAICAVNATAPLTINSYEFILRADGGTVRYDGFQNRQIEFTVSLGAAQNEVEFYRGMGSGTIKSPGTYRLASLTIEPLSGSPSVRIAPVAQLKAIALTSFGCQCEGLDQDNTMKLGSDWSDADGLQFVGADGLPPAFQPVPGVAVDEGKIASIAIVANDADSDPLSLELVGAPPFASLVNVTSEPGRIAGTVRLQPGDLDGGSYNLKIECRDGVYVSTLFLGVFVRDLNRPPAFDVVSDMLATIGSTTDQAVTAHDPEQAPITIRVKSGPAFVTVGATEPYGDGSRATVHVSPGSRDGGTWPVTLEASDGAATGTASFTVRVYDPALQHAPQLDSIPDFSLTEGDTIVYRVNARDSDGDMLNLQFVNVPNFVHTGVDPWLWLPDPGTLNMPIVIHPGAQDAGVWEATLLVSDRAPYDPFALTATRSFSITVLDRPMPPTIEVNPWHSQEPCVEPGELFRVGVYVSDPDGGPINVTFGPPPSWGSIAYSSDVARSYLLEPTSETPPQIFPIDVSASDNSGLSTSIVVPVRVARVGECVRDFVPGGPDSTVADPGGPYAAVAGEAVRFDGSRSATYGGYVPRFHWDFGDGATALGRKVEHRYEEGGRYVARLTIELEGMNRSESDTTGVDIQEPLPARAYLTPEETPIVLRSARPLVTIRLERAGEGYALEEIVPGSLKLRCAGHGEVDSIAAVSGKEARTEDGDRNGIPERAVSFPRGEIRRLFANVQGKQTIATRLEGRLPSGACVRAPLDLEVLGTPGKGVAVWPNPLNPRGTISFLVSRRGRAVVRLYAVNGRLVRTLLDGDVEAGEVQVPFDGLDARGRSLASGVYFYNVSSQDGEWRGRATILK